MQKSVEASGNAHRGVFFNVVNKASDTDVVLTGLEAGARSGNRSSTDGKWRATLWVCGRGACQGNEAEEGAWRAVWTGDLMEKKTTQVPLGAREGVVVKAGTALGCLLHSREHGVCYSEPSKGAEDSVLKVEPWSWTKSEVPFGPNKGSSVTHTPAGAIHYLMLAK